MSNEDREITLKLPLSQVGILLQAVGEIPTKFGAGLNAEIQNQVQQQLAPTPIKTPKGKAPAGAADDA